MGYLSSLLEFIRPCPIPPGESKGHPYRVPLSGKISRWSRRQILAFSISLITMTSILLLNQGLLFYTPIHTGTSNNYNIDTQIFRTNEKGETLWSYTLSIANNTSQPNRAVGFISITECSNGDFALAAPILNRKHSTTVWGLTLIRIDKDGHLLWKEFYDELDFEIGLSLVEVNSNGFAIAGTSRHFIEEVNQLDRDVFVIRTDSMGTELWTKIYDGFDSEWAYSIKNCDSGGFIITGKTDYLDEVYNDAFLHRIDDNGKTLWKHNYGGVSHDVGSSVVECNNGGFAITGTTENDDYSNSDALLIRTDEYGVELWNRTYYGIETDNGLSMIELNQGGFVITGSCTSIDNDDYHSLTEALFIHTSENGSLLIKNSLPYALGRSYVGWHYRYNCWGYMISKSNEEGYSIVGAVANKKYENWDMVLLHIDASGIILWNSTYGGQSHEFGYSLVSCNNEGYAIAGVKVTQV